MPLFPPSAVAVNLKRRCPMSFDRFSTTFFMIDEFSISCSARAIQRRSRVDGIVLLSIAGTSEGDRWIDRCIRKRRLIDRQYLRNTTVRRGRKGRRRGRRRGRKGRRRGRRRKRRGKEKRDENTGGSRWSHWLVDGNDHRRDSTVPDSDYLSHIECITLFTLVDLVGAFTIIICLLLAIQFKFFEGRLSWMFCFGFTSFVSYGEDK